MDERERRLRQRLEALERAIPTGPAPVEPGAAMRGAAGHTISFRSALPSSLPILAAVAIVAILGGSAFVGRSILLPAASPSPGSETSSPVAATSPTPSTPASLATATPGETEVPSPTPTLQPEPATPSPGPSGGVNGGWTCSDAAHLASTRTGYEPAPIGDVRVGSHDGYDRIVFEFVGEGTPAVDIAPAEPPFVTDASGAPLDVPGTVFLRIRLTTATGYPTYTGPGSFAPGFPRLTSLVRAGDYEGYVTWIAGLSGGGCYRVAVMTAPSRVVIDVQAP